MSRVDGNFPAILFAALAVTVSTAPVGLQGAPANDRFANRIELNGVSGRITASNVGATLEAGEPTHAGTGGSSVWWKWVAPADGGASFSTFGSDFDTVLAVYRGGTLSGLRPLASSDDRILFALQSSVSLEISEGTEYQIAVDGYEGDVGNIELSWSTVSYECEEPTEPFNPFPADGQDGLSFEVTLRWNQAEQLVRKVIYGADDRREIFQVDEPGLREAADSTVALVSRSDLIRRGDGTWDLRAVSLIDDVGVCPDEPFAQQPTPAFCSGFLAAPDLVVTTGHCVAIPEECGAVAVIFGFRMLDQNTPRLNFLESQVYFCEELVASVDSFELNDWGILRLDRPVADRKPLPIRRMGKVADRQNLVTIGHPLGLPAKIDDGAWVRDNRPGGYFIANLDTYGGSSGSPVFNADTLVVEGILARGEPDFDFRGNCLASVRCSDTGCGGEDVTRTTELDQLIPLGNTVTYKVFFGPLGNETFRAETQDTSWTARGLIRDRDYGWQILATNGCGEIWGPPWRFSTREPRPAYRRGDVDQDGDINITDAISLLQYLLLGGDAPKCFKSADVDDSSEENITDSVFLLNHLFLGGDAPPEPFASCGTDPTEDDLTCEDNSGCR